MRRTQVEHLVLAVAALAAVVGCGGVGAPERGRADVAVSVRALSPDAVTRVALDVQPAGVQADLAFDPATGSFRGGVAIPAGTQTFAVTVWAGDRLVGTGQETVTVRPGTSPAIWIQVLDTTAPDPVPDHAPFIVSVAIPEVRVDVGEQVTVSADAVDLDGDEVSYAWTQDCATGTFTTPDQPSTGWSSNAEGACVLTLTVRAGQLTDAVSFTIVVLHEQASPAVAGVFVPRPRIVRVDLSGSQPCTIERWSPSASCDVRFLPDEPLRVDVTVDFGTTAPDLQLAATRLTATCGSEPVVRYDWYPLGGSTWRIAYTWQTPSSGACRLDATVARGPLTDTFTVDAAVGWNGCTDAWEENDSWESASPVGDFAGRDSFTIAGLTATDDDWFVADGRGSTFGSLRVTARSSVPPVVEIWSPDDETGALSLRGAGLGGIDTAVPPGRPYYFHVAPVDACVPYDLVVDVLWAQVYVMPIPVAISDHQISVSRIVADRATPSLRNVTVYADITHTCDADLTITLVSPAGTRVLLADGRGGCGNDFRETVFDDSAGIPIGDGVAPFTGRYVPEQPLSTLAGQDARGLWTLEVWDRMSADVGTLNAWSLLLE